MPNRPFANLLNNADPAQRRLLSKARRLQALQTQLRSLLPESQADHVAVANIRGQRLVLSADSNAWATRLRYQSADLLRSLRDKGWPFLRIDVRVGTRYQLPPVQKVQRSIPASARQLLKKTAQHVDDPSLAAALQRLSQHGQTTD